MNSLDYLKLCRDESFGIPGMWATGDHQWVKASNSELRRRLNTGSVIINGTLPNWDDEVEFPVEQLVFFPKGRRVTLL
jgi:hypothetical protein